MSTVDFDSAGGPATAVANGAQHGTGPPLHRIGAVRREQGVSLRTAARQLGADAAQVRCQEQETTDLKLSELYRWQELLDVPVADLLVDPGSSLSRPVLERARLVRIMKTAAAILERSHSVGVRRMAQTMIDQLLELMPELAEVGAWHSVGQRRSLDDYGRVMEQRIAADFFHNARLED